MERLEPRLVLAGSLEGFVWSDSNFNGIQDPQEPGRVNMRVDLLDAAGQAVGSTSTSAAGVYTFSGLTPAAPYSLRFHAPTGFAFTAKDQGTDDARDSDADAAGIVAPFTVADGQTDRTRDAGVVALNTLRGNLVRDTNEDGRRNAGEAPLRGWTVFLDGNSNGQLDEGEAWRATDLNGGYSFSIPAGTYQLAAVAPAGWALTTPAAARTVTLATGEAPRTVDLAAVPAGPSRHATPVGAEFRFNQATADSQQQPSVASDAAGNFAAVWYGATGANGEGHIFARRYDAAGDARGGEFQVSTTPVVGSGWPRLTMEADGDFVVVWQGTGGIYARRFDAAGAPLGGEFTVHQSAGPKQDAHVAIDPTGGFAVTWSGETAGDTSGVAVRRYDAAGNPKGGEVRVNDSTADVQSSGGLTLDATGRLTVAYTSRNQDGNAEGVYARRFAPDGTALGGSFRVNTTTSGGQFSGGAATNAAGVMLFVWASGGDVYGQLYNPDATPRGGEFRIDSSASAANNWPSTVAALSDGSFVAAWASAGQDGSGAGVYGQLISPDGLPHGREMRLNTHTPLDQLAPSIAPGPGGAFVAAWASQGQDGSGHGVYGQRFATFTGAAAAGDFTWNDADGDGIQDAGEAGLDGVTVELYNAAGAIADTALTSGGGLYRFNSLRVGDAYRVRFVAPSGRIFSPADRGEDEAADSDADRATGLTAPFIATTGGDVRIDGGLAPASLISGAVFHDVNGDGSRAATGEPGLASWTVFLDDDADGQLDPAERSVESEVDGTYYFFNLDPGTYRVAVVPLLRWEQTTPPASLVRTLGLGQAANGVDVGERPTSATDLRAAPAGDEFRVNTTTAGSQVLSAVGSDADGDFVAVYVSGTRILGQQYSAAGVPQGGEFPVASGIALPGSTPAVAMADAGNFVATWTSNGDVYARRFDASGNATSADVRVNTTTADVQGGADVAMDADGDYVVAWESRNQDGDGTGIYAQRYAADGTPRGGEFRVNTTTVTSQAGPTVAMDAAGNFVVGWFSAHAFQGNVYPYAQRYSASGEPLGGEFRVNVDPAGTRYEHLDVAMNAGGEFIFAYRGFGPPGLAVEARRYDAQGRPQGSPFVANTATRAEFPAVALADDGTFVITWNDGNGDVAGQLFNASGIKVGQEFRVNTTTADFQYDPAVVMQPRGFVVTWTSVNQDGNAEGIYGQRFETFSRPASVGGRAFVDANNNNIREVSEAGRNGVAVSLLDDRGRVLATTTTGSGGRYQFDDLRPGSSYAIQFTLPSGSGFSAMDQGGNDATDSDVDPATGRTVSFTPAAGQVDLTRDAGLVPFGTISGAKFHDANANGVRDAGEAGLEGWTLFLDADNDGVLDPGERSAVTAADGGYSFADLRPGTYRLAEVPLLRWDLTTQVTALTVALAPGQARTVNVGNYPTAQATSASPVGGEITTGPPGEWYNGVRHNYFAADAQGNFIVLGLGYRAAGGGDEYDILARRYDASGAPRGATFIANTSTVGDQLDPAVAMAPDGSFVVAWRSDVIRNGRDVDVFAQRFDAAGQRVGAEFQVNATAAGWQSSPSVTYGPGGGFVIAFEGDDGDGTGVFARRFNAAGQPQGGDVRVSTTVAGDQYEPDVGADAAGNFVVAWHSRPENGATEVYARRFDAAGNPAGGEFPVSVPLGNHQINASLAVNAGGEFVVTWQGPSQFGWHVFAARYDSAGTRQAAVQQVSTTVNSQFPHAGLDDDGNYVVAWHNSDGAERGVFARRYTGSGLPVGGEFRVNLTTAGEQIDPMVQVLPDGDFLVAWHGRSSTDGGMQRFETFPTSGRSVVGGFVWNDADADGIFDVGEQPRPGVAVELVADSGGLAASATTSADGSFRFENVLPGAAYTLRYTLPAGAVPTLRDQGPDDARDSDADPLTARTALVAPAAGRVNLGFGLGLVPPGSVSGVKYNDRDGDGARDVGEEGLAGWIVYLDADNDGQLDPAERRETTAADGTFRFDALSPGAHRVRELPQDLWTLTSPAASLDVTLGGGQHLGGVLVGNHTSVPDTRHAAAGPAFLANTNTGGAQVLPKVAADADGDFVVVWQGPDEQGVTAVFGQRYDAAGAPRGGEFRISQAPAGSAQLSGRPAWPNVAMDADGDFVVVWEAADAAGVSDVFARRFDASGAPRGDEARVNASPDGSQLYPDVGMDDAGNYVVSWRNYSANRGVMTLRRFDASGVPLGAEVQVNPEGEVNEPSVDMNGRGEFVAVWDQWPYPVGYPSEREVMAQRFDAAGGRVGQPFQVNTLTRDEQMQPDVAVGRDGDFVVAWMSRHNGYEAHFRRYNASGVPQGDEMNLGSSDQSAYPEVAVSPADGSFVLTWGHFTGTGNDVHARRFSAAGVPQGAAFTPGPTEGNQARPGVAVDGRGQFVIAWMSQGFGTPDVYARRFALVSDPTAPAVAEARFDHRTTPHRLVYRFTEDVFDSLSMDDLLVKAVPGGVTVNPTGYAYDRVTNTATFTFAANLANGNYRATLGRAGVIDAAANPLAADHVQDFFVLAGDLNRDRKVDANDFAVLAGNFGKTGMTFEQGDLNGDGSVGGTDFAMLAESFGKSVQAPAGAVAAAPASVQPAPAPAPAPVRRAAPAKAKPPAPRRVVQPAVHKSPVPPARRVIGRPAGA